MTSATLLIPPVAPADRAGVATICAVCFGEIVGSSDTGFYCASCACHRCGEDATGGDAHDGYCAGCAATLEATGFFG